MPLTIRRSARRDAARSRTTLGRVAARTVSAMERLENRQLFDGTAALIAKVYNSPLGEPNDGADSGITSPAVTVYLDQNKNGQLDAGEQRRTTDDNGEVDFEGLDAGEYTIRQVVPSGYAQVNPTHLAGPDGLAFDVTLDDGQTLYPGGLFFNDTIAGLVSGTVYDDGRNGGNLSGVTVYADLNGNGKLDGDEPSDTTGTDHSTDPYHAYADDSYVLYGVPAGPAVIRQVLPDGYLPEQGTSASQTITVKPGQLTDGVSFVDTGATSVPGDVLTPDGKPLTGLAITLTLEDASTSKVLATTTTDPSTGAFEFDDLYAGTYLVVQTVPAGYKQTDVEPAAAGTDGPGISYAAPNGNQGGIDFVDTSTAPKLTGTAIGTAGSYHNGGNTIAKALDGSLSTFFDGPAANGDTVGLDLGAPAAITSLAYASRSGFASRMNGGSFQASNSPTFATGNVTLFTVPSNANPPSSSLTTQTVSATGTYRYVRYVAPNGSYGNVAEVQFFGTQPTTQLTGTTFGTSGSYANGNTIAKATDGNLSTFFDGPTANGNVVGLDLGSAKAVSQIKYAPRSTYPGRMVGGSFQASNSAAFATGNVTVYTITSTPAAASLTTVTTGTATAYRYWRYVSPNGSYGNVAEFQLFGTGTPDQLTGTVFGTSGSYANAGNTIFKATDGNLSTFFDGPSANGNTVGLDLGSAKSVGQIKFAPRSGYASRMVGGYVQASNSATFATGNVTVYTVNAAPTQGQLTTVSTGTSTAYRYWRYVSPNGSYGNLAELQLFG